MADEEAPAEEPTEASEAEPEAPPEDPEVTALKEEIANLESELKSKKANLSYQLDQAEEYSKAGYARTVAEMENMRRARSVSSCEAVHPVGPRVNFLTEI